MSVSSRRREQPGAAPPADLVTRWRLAVGPANYAGQAHQWARAVERRLGGSAVSFAVEQRPRLRPGRRLSFHADHRLPHPRLTTPWGRSRRMRRVLRGVTHVAVDGFLPVYGRVGRSDLGGDVPLLARQGLRVALIAHGTDLRDPDAHIQRNPFSYYATAPREWVDLARGLARRHRTIAADLGVPLFVSTPDLLLDAPWASWLPVSVAVSDWWTPRPALTARPPTVLHRPSRTVPPIKGTQVIDPVLRDLAARGRIRYLAPETVAHAAMPGLVAGADIVVDQILTGSYGVAAVEAMAAARLVIGYVDAPTRALMPEQPPIVDAPPHRFAAVLEEILADPAAYADTAAAGPAFVARWHDGRAAAEALRPFLNGSTAIP
ncbi:hypothetical protein [Micromonospora chersina]|uniref:hypothetical protein n=1 Tax=Micromonospora chersina TaxID=47854 RepID=UPI0033C48D1F